MAKKRSRHYLSKRSCRVLKFLWFYKVATTSMIHSKFFGEITTKGTYSCLLRLKQYGYICVKTDDEGKMTVWCLTKKGFNIVKDYLPELNNEGFRSENRKHDLLCTSIHLGEFLKESPKDIEFVTEQMLRNYHTEFLPSWVPSVEDHRPDGYWYFKNGKKIKLMSLEVEISKKTKTRYQAYSHFYKKFSEDSRVIWVVSSQSHARLILKAMYKYEPDYKIHNFIYLESFKKNGWDCRIFGGPDKGRKLVEIIESNSEVSAELERVHGFNLCLQDYRLKHCNN